MFKRTAVLTLFCALCVFPHLLSAGEQGSHFVVTTRFDEVWKAYSPSGEVRVELREIRVEATGPYGKAVPERILIIFEPRSGAFSWNVFDEDSLATNNSRQMLALENERAVFLKDNSLVTFMGGISPNLYVREFRGHSTNMDEAEKKALTAAAEFHTPPNKEEETRFWHTVPLPSLGRDFVSPPMSAEVGRTPRVIGLQWTGQYWVVTLQGQWTEVITLDSGYNLLGMHKLK